MGSSTVPIRRLSTPTLAADRRKRAGSVVAILVVLTGSMVVADTSTAWAKDYPSWNEVANARKNEAATKRAVTKIRSLLKALPADATAAQAEANMKGQEWVDADLDFQEAATKADTLRGQADEAQQSAEESRKRMGEIVARLYRGGSLESETIFFGNSGAVDDLLYGLSMIDKVGEQSNSQFVRATADRNSAEALTDQADTATNLREELRVTAEEAFVAAQRTAESAENMLKEQTANEARLEQQLKVLSERRSAVESDYRAGVKEREASDGGDSVASGQGWARPAAGRITSPYGWRIHPISKTWRLHTGTDYSASCGTPTYSASSGKVTYAGPNGSFGNFILIDHGSGVSTAYAHIQDGGILVSLGQKVTAGKLIAKAGTTGGSTGCHTHFEVRVNGVTTDPPAFLRKHGVLVG